MTRRDLIALLGSTAVMWPPGAPAQQPERVRRIGVLIGFDESDPEGQARLAAFRQALQALGWTGGANLHIDYRRYAGDPDSVRSTAAELIGLSPEMILAYAPSAVAALHRETCSIPIVFTQVSNPLGAGFITSMGHPGGNITGFTSFELTFAAKWLEALKESPGRRSNGLRTIRARE